MWPDLINTPRQKSVSGIKSFYSRINPISYLSYSAYFILSRTCCAPYPRYLSPLLTAQRLGREMAVLTALGGS